MINLTVKQKQILKDWFDSIEEHDEIRRKVEGENLDWFAIGFLCGMANLVKGVPQDSLEQFGHLDAIRELSNGSVPVRIEVITELLA